MKKSLYIIIFGSGDGCFSKGSNDQIKFYFIDAGTASGKVTEIITQADGGNGHGVFMFVVDGERSNVPACGSEKK